MTVTLALSDGRKTYPQTRGVARRTPGSRWRNDTVFGSMSAGRPPARCCTSTSGCACGARSASLRSALVAKSTAASSVTAMASRAEQRDGATHSPREGAPREGEQREMGARSHRGTICPSGRDAGARGAGVSTFVVDLAGRRDGAAGRIEIG